MDRPSAIEIITAGLQIETDAHLLITARDGQITVTDHSGDDGAETAVAIADAVEQWVADR